MKKQTAVPACLLAALAVAALLRFANLGQKPLWCDELATLQRLSLPFAEHLSAMRGNHPLYEMLLRFWMPPDGSDTWMRIPSAALGVLAVWLTWLLARRAGAVAGLTAAWLMALNPLALMYSRIGRAYSLSCALALAATLAMLWALKRRRFLPFLLYVLSTAVLIYSNLVAASLALGQGLFLLWFFRRRLWRLAPWAASYVAIGLLLAPWMLPNTGSAVTWGSDTAYTARQFGLVAKACYLPLTFCLGETVHPLNLWVVIPAFLAFGAAGAYGLYRTLRFRRALMMFLLIQIIAVYGLGLHFAAAAPKHLLVVVPAWTAFLAVSLVRMPGRGRATILLAAMALVSAVSIVNYFTDRQFADADMVTPWREIAVSVEEEETPGDALLIGYRPDRGVYDIFQRYYRGKLKPAYVDFKEWRRQLEEALRGSRPVWLLLHDGDPWAEVEGWLRTQKAPYMLLPFQEEEHTLAMLRAKFAGGAGPGEFTSPLYRLYRIGPMEEEASGGNEPE